MNYAAINKNHDAQNTKKITRLDVILQQNFSFFKDHIYQPERGISLGTPISCAIAEVF